MGQRPDSPAAYYARCDRLMAGYERAVAEGREPSWDERNEAARQRQVAVVQVLAAARRIVWREYKRYLAETEQGAV